jgi:uncharacterized protein
MSSELDRKTRTLAMWCHLLILPGQIILAPLTILVTYTLLPLIISFDKPSHDLNFILSLSIIFLMPFVDFCLSTLVSISFWKLNRHRDPFIEESGKESTNFWLSIILYLFAIDAITLASCGFPTFKTSTSFSKELAFLAIGLNLILMLFVLATIIVASIHSAKGRMYRYPFIVRFLR